MRSLGVLLAVAVLVCAACQPSGQPTGLAPASAPGAAQAPARSAAEGASASGGVLTPEVQRLLAAARENGETDLNLSWSGNSIGGAEGITRYQALFNKMYGTNVKFNFTPGPSMSDMAGRVGQEMAAGRKASSDVLLGTDSHLAALLPQEVMEEYDYTLLSPRITPDVVAYRNVAVEIYTTTPGITYNTELVAQADVPQRLEDALQPRWRGRIASTQDAAYFDVVAMRPEWGLDRMRTYVGRLSEQAAGLLRVGEDARIASGEFWMFVMQHAQGVRQARAAGAPLGHIIPEDSAVARFVYLGVPKNSARPNLGKLFVNTIVSEEGQRIIYETYYTDHHALPGSQSAASLADLKAKGIEPLRISLKFVLDHPELRPFSEELQKILREKRAG
jgi:ABC-type Fe3+ transport system substrate-binding protein